jgi:hypothetical protein
MSTFFSFAYDASTESKQMEEDEEAAQLKELQAALAM